MFTVYILQSSADLSFYYSQTSNLCQRLDKHNQRRIPSTATKAPWVLVAFKNVHSRSQDVILERKLKNLKSTHGLIPFLLKHSFIFPDQSTL